MQEYAFKQSDFQHPGPLWVLEDVLKGMAGTRSACAYYRTLGLAGDETVLDFGCGGGLGSRCLAGLLTRGGRLTCVDISRFWIARAEKRLKQYPNARCLCGDIRQLELNDASFDVISTSHVIHDIAPAERQATIDTLARKLRPGGLFFIREPLKKSHGMAAAEIRGLLSQAGLIETGQRETKKEFLGRYQKAA